MRILVLDTYYPAFLAAHYAARPGLGDRTYDEQLNSLMERFFGTSDAYSRHLREHDHTAVDMVPNCAPLQRAWQREHAGRRLLPSRLTGIALAQIEAFQPDVVYCQDLSFLRTAELRKIKASGALLVGQVASAAPSVERLREFDLVTTSFPHFVERFRALGVDTEYLQIGFYERVREYVGEQNRDLAVVFAGGVDPRVHPAGVALLEEVAERIPLQVWGYGAEALPRSSPLRSRHRGAAWGLDMYTVLARSRIVINRHIEAAEGWANNMRLFEATGMGALLLTEDAPNLADLFVPGGEVVTYRGADDLVEKALHYLDHEEDRMAIAAAGRARTLSDHTYREVIDDLDRLLRARAR